MSDQEYDVIVIGVEPTGENVAERARRGGRCLCPPFADPSATSASAAPSAARFGRRHRRSNRHDVKLYRLLPVQIHIVPTAAQGLRCQSGAC